MLEPVSSLYVEHLWLLVCASDNYHSFQIFTGCVSSLWGNWNPWTSGDVCPWFQSYGGSIACLLFLITTCLIEQFCELSCTTWCIQHFVLCETSLAGCLLPPQSGEPKQSAVCSQNRHRFGNEHSLFLFTLFKHGNGFCLNGIPNSANSANSGKLINQWSMN